MNTPQFAYVLVVAVIVAATLLALGLILGLRLGKRSGRLEAERGLPSRLASERGDAVRRSRAVLGGLAAEQLADLAGALDRVLANLRLAASLFVNADTRAARLLVEEKLTFRTLENAATAAHFAAMRAGDAAETSALHLDLLRDIRRVHAHLVAAAAYPVLKNQGELLESRLRLED